MGAAVKGIVVAIVVIMALTAVYYVVEDTNLLNGVVTTTTSSYQIPSEITTHFSRNFTFTSSSSSGETFTFYFTPTINDSLQQSDIAISHSSNVNETVKSSQNRTFVALQISPGNSYVNVSYNIKSYSKIWKNDTNSSGLISQIPSSLKNEYDHPEYFNSSGSSLEVINPSFFRNITLNLTKNDTTVVEKLRSIYNYIVQNYRYNITYNLGNVPLSAQQVYQLKEGDCEELSYLFESMSRSIGIPSWTQYGLLIQDTNGQTSLGEHAWVQTYIPTSNGTGNFVNIDLTVEVGGKDLGRGFLVKFPYSLVEWTDNGNSTAMVAYHTELLAPSNGINIAVQENDTVYSFTEYGNITIAQANLFYLPVAYTSKDQV